MDILKSQTDPLFLCLKTFDSSPWIKDSLMFLQYT